MSVTEDDPLVGAVSEPSTETASEEVKAATVTLDEFGQMAVERLNTQQIPALNSAANAVKAASGDPLAVLDDLRENFTENAAVNKAREFIAKALEQIAKAREDMDKHLQPLVESRIADAASGGEKARAAYDELLGKVNVGIKYLKANYGDESLSLLVPIVKVRASSSASTGGTGFRVRGYTAKVDGTLATIKDNKDVERSNLSAAAKVLGVGVDVIQTAFKDAIGGEAIATGNRDKWPATVEFTISTDDKDEAGNVTRVTHTVVCERAASNADATAEVSATQADAEAAA